jgi:hypothetical protein
MAMIARLWYMTKRSLPVAAKPTKASAEPAWRISGKKSTATGVRAIPVVFYYYYRLLPI